MGVFLKALFFKKGVATLSTTLMSAIPGAAIVAITVLGTMVASAIISKIPGSRQSSNTSRRSSRTNSSGRRRRSSRYDDESSSTVDPGAGHDESRHILRRLTRWFRFGGLIHRISHETRIARDDIVEAGSSAYQDRSSGLGTSGIHAAHLVRAGRINSLVDDRNPSLYRGLRDFLGHTENVFSPINTGLVGRAIDEFQTTDFNLWTLHSIGFDKDPRFFAFYIVSERRRVALLVNRYVKMLMRCLDRTSDVNMQRALRSAITLIRSKPLSYFFEAGRKGYIADFDSWKRNNDDD